MHVMIQQKSVAVYSHIHLADHINQNIHKNIRSKYAQELSILVNSLGNGDYRF